MRIIQRVLLAATFPFLIVSCVQINRIQKNIREGNGDGVLRENKRFKFVSTAVVICFAGSQVLEECVDHPEISLWAIVVKVLCACAIYVLAVRSAFQAFERKGNELKKNGQ